MKKRELILASASPRRIEMMKNNGYDPMILPSSAVENLPFAMEKETAVMYLSLKKALDIEAQCLARADVPSSIIVAADTIVYYDRIIGKPKNEKEAFETLSMLRGKSHYVITGVALVKMGAPERKVFFEVSKVFFESFSDDELRSYVKTSEPYDKAGGYAIQGTFGKYVNRIEGDMDNIIGFPWTRFQQELQTIR